MNRQTMLLILILALISTFHITMRQGGIVGWDFTYHEAMARAWLTGAPTLTNFGFYPPLFHWFLAALMWLGILLPAAISMQIVIYPTIIFTTSYVVREIKGRDAAVLTAIIMFSSFALFDRSQVIPQSVTMIFMPLGVLAFLRGKRWVSLFLIGIALYSHGIYAFPALGAMLLYSCKHAEFRRTAILGFILFLPLIGYMTPSINDMVLFAGEVTNPQNEMIIENPWFFVEYMGILPAFLLLASPLSWKHGKFFIFWIIFTVPLVFIEADRFASLVMPPVAIVGSFLLDGWLKKNIHYRKLAIICMLALSISGSFINILML